MIAKILFIMILTFMFVGLVIALFEETKTFQAIDDNIADWINRQRGVE